MRVVLAEDLYLLRDGLVRLLEAHGHEVVAAVDSGPALREALVAQPCDVAIVDVRLPPTYTDEGLQAAIEARRRTPGRPVLVLSQHVEQLYARELLASGDGGVGYLLKERVMNADQLLDAATRVAAGGTAMDPEVIAKLLTTRQDPLSRLTARERDVLELMAQGRSNIYIAGALSLSQSAIGKHTNSIFAKLELPPSDDDNRRVLAVLDYLQR